MQRYILKRLLQGLVTIFGITLIIFILVRISGDPVAAMMPPEAPPEAWEMTRKMLGLDQPIYVQYWRFVSRVVQGDFGMSIRYSVPCVNMFWQMFPNTVQLASAAMFISLMLGIPVGIISAMQAGRWFDQFGKIFAILGQAMPVFWLGLLLILVIGVELRWLPVAGMGDLRNLIMPAFTLGWFFTASILRLTRSAMLDVLDSEYIKMIRIKGLPERSVILKHALKNASIPIVGLATLNFVSLLMGTVITETIFAWPGVGRLIVESVNGRDFPMIQTGVIIFSFMFVFATLVVDILYAYLDPRIKYG